MIKIETIDILKRELFNVLDQLGEGAAKERISEDVCHELNSRDIMSKKEVQDLIKEESPNKATVEEWATNAIDNNCDIVTDSNFSDMLYDNDVVTKDEIESELEDCDRVFERMFFEQQIKIVESYGELWERRVQNWRDEGAQQLLKKQKEELAKAKDIVSNLPPLPTPSS